MKQTSFQRTHWAHQFSHGGSLRNQRAGRTARPLSSKEPIHLVLKTNKGLSGAGLRSARRFALAQKLLRKYSTRFHVKVEQVSIQFDHIHLLVRITRRSLFQHFLRVLAGQMAQQFQTHGLSIKKRPSLQTKETEIRVQDTRRRPSKNAGAAFSKKPSGAAVTDTPITDIARRRAGDATASKLWKYRPFTRVVRGYKAYQVVRDYIQLNEKEATGEIRYSQTRLRGLLSEDLARLWR